MFLLVKLLITAFLFLHDFSFHLLLLFDLSFLQKLYVLFLQLLVHFAFLDFSNLAAFLFMELLFEFFPDKSLSFLVSENGLFLLFVVEKSIELLNGSPFVILVNLWVHFSFLGLRRCHRQSIELSTMHSTSFFSRHFRYSWCSAHPRTCNWSRFHI